MLNATGLGDGLNGTSDILHAIPEQILCIFAYGISKHDSLICSADEISVHKPGCEQ